MSTRQDSIEERLTSLEEKLTTLQVHIIILILIVVYLTRNSNEWEGVFIHVKITERHSHIDG